MQITVQQLLMHKSHSRFPIFVDLGKSDSAVILFRMPVCYNCCIWLLWAVQVWVQSKAAPHLFPQLPNADAQYNAFSCTRNNHLFGGKVMKRCRQTSPVCRTKPTKQKQWCNYNRKHLWQNCTLRKRATSLAHMMAKDEISTAENLRHEKEEQLYSKVTRTEKNL